MAECVHHLLRRHTSTSAQRMGGALSSAIFRQGLRSQITQILVISLRWWCFETKEDKHEKEIDALILAENILMIRMIITADEIFFTAQVTINQVSLYVYLASKVEIFFCLSNPFRFLSLNLE